MDTTHESSDSSGNEATVSVVRFDRNPPDSIFSPPYNAEGRRTSCADSLLDDFRGDALNRKASIDSAWAFGEGSDEFDLQSEGKDLDGSQSDVSEKNHGRRDIGVDEGGRDSKEGDANAEGATVAKSKKAAVQHALWRPFEVVHPSFVSKHRAEPDVPEIPALAAEIESAENGDLDLDGECDDAALEREMERLHKEFGFYGSRPMTGCSATDSTRQTSPTRLSAANTSHSFTRYVFDSFAEHRKQVNSMQSSFMNKLKDRFASIAQTMLSGEEFSKQDIPFLTLVLQGSLESARKIIREEMIEVKGIQFSLMDQLMTNISSEYEVHEVVNHQDVISKRDFIDSTYKDKITNLRRAAKVRLKASLLRQESVFRQSWKNAFQEHEEDMRRLVLHYTREIERMRSYYDMEVLKREDVVSNLKVEILRLQDELHEAQVYKEKFLASESQIKSLGKMMDQERKELIGKIELQKDFNKNLQRERDNEVALRLAADVKNRKTIETMQKKLMETHAKLSKKAKDAEALAKDRHWQVTRLVTLCKFMILTMQRGGLETSALQIDLQSIIKSSAVNQTQSSATMNAPISGAPSGVGLPDIGVGTDAEYTNMFASSQANINSHQNTPRSIQGHSQSLWGDVGGASAWVADAHDPQGFTQQTGSFRKPSLPAPEKPSTPRVQRLSLQHTPTNTAIINTAAKTVVSSSFGPVASFHGSSTEARYSPRQITNDPPPEFPPFNTHSQPLIVEELGRRGSAQRNPASPSLTDSQIRSDGYRTHGLSLSAKPPPPRPRSGVVNMK